MAEINPTISSLHRPGQSTSQRALEATGKSRSAMYERVLDRIKRFGGAGAIPEEIWDVMLGLDVIDIRRSFCVLKKKGLIVSTGEERKNPKGHWCEVWRAL